MTQHAGISDYPRFLRITPCGRDLPCCRLVEKHSLVIKCALEVADSSQSIDLGSPHMNTLNRYFMQIALLSALLVNGIAHAADINGAGATFPAPAYEKWAAGYKSQANFGMGYQAIGSGAGIKQIIAKIVDFGASDVPMSPADLTANGLTQFPTLVGGVVPVVNLANVQPGQLNLSGEVLADIYMGKITQWNDAR